MYESIKALQNRTSIIFNLSFLNSTILSCFFFFLLMVDLYFLIPEMFAQMFYPTTELVIQTETQINGVNTETETQSVTTEARTNRCLT